MCLLITLLVKKTFKKHYAYMVNLFNYQIIQLNYISQHGNEGDLQS